MNLEDKWLDYLYNELPLEEKLSFEQLLEEDPQLKSDLQQWKSLLVLSDQAVPQLKVPKVLTRRVLSQVGIKKSWGYQVKNFLRPLWSNTWLKPALGGAFAVLMIFLVRDAYFNQQGTVPTPVAQKEEVIPRQGPELPMQDLSNPKYFVSGSGNAGDSFRPDREFFPSFKSRQNHWPRVTRASLGETTDSNPMEAQELAVLDILAEQEMAQLMHQKALSLRSFGDCTGAAEQLGSLIKKYPFYSFKIHAMAQRIDCLYQSGEQAKALEELEILKELSPSLTLLLKRRWKS